MGLFPARGKSAFVPTVQRTVDVMQSLGRTATEAALDSLSKLVQKQVHIDRSRVALVPAAHLADQFRHLDGQRVGASFRFEGGLEGAVAAVFGRDEACRLVDLLLGHERGATTEFGELETSALAEMTNIALNNALNAVGTETTSRYRSTVPTVAPEVDESFYAGLRVPGKDADHVVVIESPFHEPGHDVRGVLLLVFSLPSD